MLRSKLHIFLITILLTIVLLVACKANDENAEVDSHLTTNKEEIEYTTDDKQEGVSLGGKIIYFETVDDYNYIYPSKEHLQLNAESSVKNDNNRIYTMNSLFDDYYDDEIEEMVDVAKNLSAGDNIIVTDTINDIEYDGEENMTVFEFSTTKHPQYLSFKGDLTNDYKVGDLLSFEFEIVELHADYPYTTLDYSLVIRDEGYPEITDFLLP